MASSTSVDADRARAYLRRQFEKVTVLLLPLEDHAVKSCGCTASTARLARLGASKAPVLPPLLSFLRSPHLAHLARSLSLTDTPAMAQQQRIIFYDLVAEHGGPFFSPNTLKTRFSLLHKGVDFEEREVTFMELREMGPKMGLERAISAGDSSLTCGRWADHLVRASQSLVSSFQTEALSTTHGTSPSE